MIEFLAQTTQPTNPPSETEDPRFLGPIFRGWNEPALAAGTYWYYAQVYDSMRRSGGVIGPTKLVVS